MVIVPSTSCILGELFLRKALFPGTHEFNQLEVIRSVLYLPTGKRFSRYYSRLSFSQLCL